MKYIVTTTWYGIRQSLEGWPYRALSAVVFVGFFGLFITLPILLEPGSVDDITYAVSWVIGFLNFQDYITITFLSLLYALFIPMQVYAIRQKREYKGVGTAVGGGIGTLFAGIAGTAFCASCLAPIFALFGIGFGGVIFVLQYRFYFVIGIAILMLLAIYLTARKIQRACDTC